MREQAPLEIAGPIRRLVSRKRTNQPGGESGKRGRKTEQFEKRHGATITRPIELQVASKHGSRPKPSRRRLKYAVLLHLASEAIALLTIYAKSVRDNIPVHVLRKIAEELGNGY